MSDAQDASLTFNEVVLGLKNGDFTRLSPLFDPPADATASGQPCPILQWHAAGLFDREPAALNEALTCACFLGKVDVATRLLDAGVDPAAGNATGMTALHWAANRGEIQAVRLLLARGASMEILNMYGGTALGGTVWSALHEPRAGQLQAIELLLRAGANVRAVGYPTGHAAVDELLARHGARP